MLRRDLEAYLGDYLGVGSFDDEAVNGLQVQGRREIRRLVVAVSACSEVFQKALALNADAVLVHHGLFWKGHGPEPVVGVLRDRLSLLLTADVSLFAYHLPLDAHGEVGNNSVAARDLGLRDLVPFGEYHSMTIGWRGSFPEAMARHEFISKLEGYYGHPAQVVPGGPETVTTVGVISGGAAREASQAARLNLDAYVTGEPSEPVTYLCRESGLNFAALGHYATERVGVRALAKHLETRWGLETQFVDVENEA